MLYCGLRASVSQVSCLYDGLLALSEAEVQVLTRYKCLSILSSSVADIAYEDLTRSRGRRHLGLKLSRREYSCLTMHNQALKREGEVMEVFVT